MVTVTVYVEGGGQSKALKTKCRAGFRKFFEKAKLVGQMPSVVACGGRDSAVKDFRNALRRLKSGEVALLLVDSEGPVQEGITPWQHLKSRDKWDRPDGAQEDQAHLMVQCMETWFLADVSALEEYFGSGFRSSAIPQRNDIENISTSDVLRRLKAASSGSRKREYHKGNHSFDILARIDPECVLQRSPRAKRLIDTLKSHLIPA